MRQCNPVGKATYGSTSCLSRAAAARKSRTGSHKDTERKESRRRNAYGATAAGKQSQCKEAAQETGLEENTLKNSCSGATRIRWFRESPKRHRVLG